MADEGAKLRITALARLEKYPVGANPEDIRTGKIKPEEVITSEDVLVEPDTRKLHMLQNMGYTIPQEAWDKASELEETKIDNNKEEIIDGTD